MDKKKELINEIELAKKEFYDKNPCNHCVGNGCDDCRDCSEAQLRYQLSGNVYNLKKKFKQEYGEDYDAFKENERNNKLNVEVKSDNTKNIDLTKLSSDELRKLSEDINERLFDLRKEEEITESQEFCKTLEFGAVYCEKKYNFYNDNTVYTIIKINGFELNEKGRPYVQYTYYSITNKPDNFTNNLSIKCDEMNAPVEAIKHMTIFSNRITKDAETIISEVETLYNRATTQLDVINTETFNKVNELVYEHCKNLKD